MQALADERLTIDQFLDRHEGERVDLVRGRVQAMSGGSRLHSRTAGKIFAALSRKLGDGPCEPHIFEMGVRTAEDTLRYPDVVILCNPDELNADPAEQRYVESPKVLFEVLSPSTERQDRIAKVSEYKSILSVDTIVLVDPAGRRFETYERSSEREWLNVVHLEGASLRLRDPQVELTADEMFYGL